MLGIAPSSESSTSRCRVCGCRDSRAWSISQAADRWWVEPPSLSSIADAPTTDADADATARA